MLTPTGIGAVGVAAYAAQTGVTPETFVAGMAPVLTPEQVAKSVVDLVGEPDNAAEYELTGTGPRAIG